MSNKITVENYCEKCGSEYMVTYDPENNIDEPSFCAFCAELIVDDELDFDED